MREICGGRAQGEPIPSWPCAPAQTGRLEGSSSWQWPAQYPSRAGNGAGVARSVVAWWHTHCLSKRGPDGTGVAAIGTCHPIL